MTDRPDSLRAAFGLDEESVRELRATVGRSQAVLSMARGALSGSAPALLDGAVENVQDRVEEVLDTPLSGILASAWRAYAPFLEYCDQRAHPPGDVAEVELETHTVHASLRPYVEVSMDGARLGRIDLELEVEVKLDAAILVIENGRFMELRSGRSTFEGTLSLAGARLAHAEKPVALPGRIPFGDGIPIAPPVVPVAGVPVVA